MIAVQCVELGVSWQCGQPVASPLRVTFGAVGQETTVDQMVQGHGFAMMKPEQLAHLIAGMAFSAELTPIRLRNSDAVQQTEVMILRSLLQIFGYQVELC